MRAYQLPQATGIDALVRVDLPAPKPGPRQVLIKAYPPVPMKCCLPASTDEMLLMLKCKITAKR